MGLLRRLRQLQPGEQVILAADLAINLGFFMLIPFISVHVRDNLGLTATVAGIVLATRMGVQQVLTIFAGPTADLYGYKRLLLAGLVVRCIGFSSFALMSDFPGLLLSSVLSGAGGAMFSAAVRPAFAALGSSQDQAGRFTLLYTAQSVGTTLGPLVGALLLGFDFRILSLAAGLVYLPIAAMVYLFLPNIGSGREEPRHEDALAGVLRSLWVVAQNRAFVTYCLISCGFWVISGQINISLSLSAATVTGSQTAVKFLLLTSSLMVICLQYWLQQRLEGRFRPEVQWAVGALLAACSFLVLIPFPGFKGLITCVVLLTFGGMLMRPVDFQLVMGLAPRDSLASYYGFSAISVAIGGSAGQFLGGRLTDLAATSGQPWLPWVVFAGIGLATAGAMLGFGQRGATVAPAVPVLK